MKYGPSRVCKSIVIIIGIFFSAALLSPGTILASEEQQIFANGNDYRVENGPTVATTFKLDRLWLVTYFLAYHYNGGAGQTPGTLALRHEDGTMYGPWQATGGPDLQNPTNLYWVCRPQFVLKPGVYTVIDSDPATWSWNGGSVGGIVIIKGRPVSEAPNQPVKTSRVTQEFAQIQKAFGNVLISKTLEPSTTSQRVVYKDEVGVIIPGGTIENQQTVTISPAPDLPAHPFKGFTPLASYDISMGSTRQFSKPLTIEIAYDPSKLSSNTAPDKALSVSWWDADQKIWVSAPFAVDTTRNVVMIPTTHLTVWDVWAKAKGWDVKETEHFNIYYDPKAAIAMTSKTSKRGGVKTENTQAFVAEVAAVLDNAYKVYGPGGAKFDMSLTYLNSRAGGAAVGVAAGGILGWMAGGAGVVEGASKGGTLGGKIGAVVGAVVVSQKTNVFLDQATSEAHWDRLTGNISVPLNFDNYDQLRHELRHELFHAVQNGYFPISGMYLRKWWVEATADYAPVDVGLDKPDVLSKITPDFFQKPLITQDEKHEYRVARFLAYAVTQGLNFKAMWDATSCITCGEVLANLEQYALGRGRDLPTLFRDFAADTFFNSNGPLELEKGKTLETSGAVSANTPLPSAEGAMVPYDFKLPANYTAQLWRIPVEFKGSQNERSVKVEVTSQGLPSDKVAVSALVLPGDQRIPGGVSQKSIPLISEKNKIAGVTVSKDQVLYILAVNSQTNAQTISVKVFDGALSISPLTTSVVTGKNITFTSPGAAEKVLWTVQEGANGGTIDVGGVYTAPNKPGTYHVAAALESDPSKSVAATVTVTEEVKMTELRTVKVSDTEEITGFFQGDKLIKRHGISKLFQSDGTWLDEEYQDGKRVHAKIYNEDRSHLSTEMWFRGDDEFKYQQTNYSWDGKPEFEYRRQDKNSKWQSKISTGEWIDSNSSP